MMFSELVRHSKCGCPYEDIVSLELCLELEDDVRVVFG